MCALSNRLAVMSSWLLWCAMVLGIACPSPGRAEAPGLPEGSTIAILPGGDLTSNAREGEVRASLVAGLRQLGHRAMLPQEVRRRLADAGQPELCESLSGCDYAALLELLGADALAVYSLWLEDGQPREFAVGITRAGGGRGDASHRLADGESLAPVVPRVFMHALQAATGADTGGVRIETDPPGAEIEIDRRLTGTSPAHFDLSPGQHEVRATAEGRVALLDYVEVEAGEGEQLVALVLAEAEAPILDDSPVELSYRKPNHTLDYVLGGVLGAAAVGALVYGAVTFKDESDKCYVREDGPLGRCIVIASPPTLTVAALAAGGVLATGSVLLFTLTPFTNSSGDVAGLRLQGRF